MSGRINIPASINDDHYRYTRPLLKLKEESRLNGVKTNITNLDDIAFALRVPPNTIIKYFCAEVGSNHVKDSLMMGSHDVSQLEKHLEKFITKFVLCAKCKYPELTISVDKKGKKLNAMCNACGMKAQLDHTHKAGKQLIKDIPNMKGTEFGNKMAAKGESVKERQLAETTAQENEIKEPKKPKKLTEEQKAERAQKIQNQIETGEEINEIDAEELALDSEDIKNACNNIDMLLSEEATCAQVLDQVRRDQISLNITADYKYFILIAGIFNPKRSMVKHWEKYAPCFSSLAAADGDIGLKRVFQAILIFYTQTYPSMQNQAPTFCKTLYDTEFFTGEFFVQWHESKNYFLDKNSCMYDRKASKEMKAILEPFVKYVSEQLEQEYDGEYDEEEEAKTEEKATLEPVQESEAQKVQREQIAKMQAAKEEAMQKARDAAQQEAKPEKPAAENNEEKLNIADMDLGDEEIDLDDL